METIYAICLFLFVSIVPLFIGWTYALLILFGLHIVGIAILGPILRRREQRKSS